jgi:hypothetical protein
MGRAAALWHWPAKARIVHRHRHPRRPARQSLRDEARTARALDVTTHHLDVTDPARHCSALIGRLPPLERAVQLRGLRAPGLDLRMP